MDAAVGEDERLLLAARIHAGSFGVLYERRRPVVAAYLRRRTRCPHTSAELTAETFAEAWRWRHRFDPAAGSAMAWLTGIARNLHRSWLRRGAVGDRAGQRLGNTTSTQAMDDLDRIEHLADLARGHDELVGALDGLSPKLRAAVVLRVAFDLPYGEVAAQLGCSHGAARVRVARGLDGLAAQLGADAGPARVSPRWSSTR